ncbi:alpha/beta fold hydrolase [Flavobacterium sp. TP390]|uniref:Alpha/beta fold hydrolase n=1 Tax=Flavobacterium profundi TaxID=1774945 RepID=A0A6I4ISN5_9FLAO|nr:alpha/beta fold hydrolase [Flavobacterium profundi]MVO09387.1 alpha/beta fold hydrolase [Flavobacterium profundi]
MKNIFLTIAPLLFISSCSNKIMQSGTSYKETKIDLSTHNLTAYSIIHNTKYLMVFESGLGDNHTIWDKKSVAIKISSKSDVLLYDRAGYGKSKKGTAPRNIAKLSEELDSTINKFSNGRKVILVGHSLGGFIIRDYAIKNPAKIAGLLFIDPSHENFNRPSQTQENLITFLVGLKSVGSKMEAKQLIEDAQYMATLENLPNVPVIVLTSMKQDDTNINADKAYNKTRQDWYNAHELLNNGVTDFTHIQTTNSSHYIMNDEPNLIIESLNLLLSKLP